jgi:hypothetical protein
MPAHQNIMSNSNEKPKSAFNFIPYALGLVIGAILVIPLWIASTLFDKHLVNNTFLQKAALDWPVYKLIFIPVRIVCFMLLLPGSVLFIWIFRDTDYSTAIKIFWASLTAFIWMAILVVFKMTTWMERTFNSPEVQQKRAGLRAEKAVEDFIDRNIASGVSGLALHNQLLVFKSATPSEHSVELDHMLITKKNVFVIETKYKSGEVSVDTQSDEWSVVASHGKSTMRNALNQVKNSIKTLKSNIGVLDSLSMVPVVVFVGSDLKIRNAPSNVVALDGLASFIAHFELASHSTGTIDQDVIEQTIKKYADSSDLARQNHIHRIHSKVARNDAESVYKSASID